MRVINDGVLLSVTLSTGRWTSAQKTPSCRLNFPWKSVSAGPPSTPVNRSARSWGLAWVSVFPKRNERYNSFRVGERKDRYADTRNETASLMRYLVPSLGSNEVSDRLGKDVGVNFCDGKAVVLLNPSMVCQSSKRDTPVSTQRLVRRATSSTYTPVVRSSPPASTRLDGTEAVKISS